MSREDDNGKRAGGKTYSEIKSAAISMKQKVFVVEDRENKQFLAKSMYGDIAYNDGKLYIEFEPSMEKYFLNLKQNFSKLKLPILFSYKKNGGFQLYKLLKSYAYPPNLEHIDMSLTQEELPTFSLTWDLTALRSEMGYVDLNQPLIKEEITLKAKPDWNKIEQIEKNPKYKRWSDFKARVIDPGIEEINEISDIYIKEVVKKRSGKGARIQEITFIIQHNKAYYENHPEALPTKAVGMTSDVLDDRKEDFIDELSDVIAEKVKPKDLKAIAEASGYDMDKIKRIYELAKNSDDIYDLVGWIISGLKKGYSEPVSKKKKNDFNNFKQREYDFDELERDVVNM
jgi:plasmid replication initiation protein